MDKITAHAESVRKLLAQKYAVDSYQREYKWGKKQIGDLVNDLTLAFGGDYEESHKRSNVKNYGQYFLGPIIISEESDKQYIVDGQQRLTSLTLMLIVLLHSACSEEQRAVLRDLIYSDQFGNKSFNLDVPERTECLNQLYQQGESTDDSASESVRNLNERYEQIDIELKDALSKEQLPLFIDYLIEKVYLVEIRASSNSDAYAIFETMNDRGLRLSPVEMLKGYLLSEIKTREDRECVNNTWKTQVDQLIAKVGKDEDASAIKAWLRGQHTSESVDFDAVGSQFHRWVRDNKEKLKLNSVNGFVNFIQQDFKFYVQRYLRLREAADDFDGKTPYRNQIYFLAQHSFTLQYTALLSVLSPDDSEQEIENKLHIVAIYLDILIHYRIGNAKQIDESSMRDAILKVIKKIRNKSVTNLATLLSDDLRDQFSKANWNSVLAPDFALHGNNGPRIHRILARITDYVETESEMPSHYTDYFATGKKSFQIEHVWPDHFDDARKNEFSHEYDFQNMRNRIGGLLLLPNKDNASYNDKPYAEKYKYYDSQNLLVRSLHENCYTHNPGFRDFVRRSQLPFKHYTEFSKADLEQRQKLYLALADKIWHPRRLHEAAGNGN